MAYVFTNNASSFLQASITPTQTTIIVGGDQAETFPSPTDGDRAMIVLEDRARAKLEVCELLSRSGATLTISRGKEGTVAQAFTVLQTVVSHRPTAGVMNYLVSQIGDFNKRYLGSSATPPTVDRDGADLQVGALYFDTVEQAMFVYTDTGWQTFGGSGYDGGFSLPPGGAAGDALILDENLDVVFGVPVDSVARAAAGAAQATADAKVDLVGDTMTGPLNIDSGTAGQTLLTVDGIALFVEAAKLGNANSGWIFNAGGNGTADDKIQAKLNGSTFAELDVNGWNFYSGNAKAAAITNPTAASTTSMLAYEADLTTVPPMAGAVNDDFVIKVKPGASVRVEDTDGNVLLDSEGYTSGAQTFTASSTMTFTHGLGRTPNYVRIRAKLKSGQSDAGYAESDGYLELESGSTGFQIYYDGTAIHCATGTNGPEVITKTFGNVRLDWTKWNFYIFAN